jgi:hypothetical protein
MPIFDPATVTAAYMADPDLNREPIENELAKWRELLSCCPLYIPAEENRQAREYYEALLQFGLTYSRPEEREGLIRSAEAYRLKLPMQHRFPSDRALPDELLRWVRSLVDFYCGCGGKPGVGADTDCSRFIRAMATGALEERGWTVRDTTPATLIRRVLKRVNLMAAGHAAGPPDIGTPDFRKNLPEEGV